MAATGRPSSTLGERTHARERSKDWLRATKPDKCCWWHATLVQWWAGFETLVWLFLVGLSWHGWDIGD